MSKLDADGYPGTAGDGALAAELERRTAEASDAVPEATEDEAHPVMLPAFQSIAALVQAFPRLRPPVIDGLLRKGETMNVIGTTKVGKSWMVTDLAISVAAGLPWLGFDVTQGEVLILDNELHGETLASRIPCVLKARGISLSEVEGRLWVERLRGKQATLDKLGAYFRAVEAGRFRLIVLDALYRALPEWCDENSNADMGRVYNQIDQYADSTRASWTCVHHPSKGGQAEKSVTDVGSGAGSMSRATDTHLILRPHEVEDAVVLEAVTRTWKRPGPICLRWEFPLWRVAADLDPAKLAQTWRRKGQTQATGVTPAPPPWTVERFVGECVTATPEVKAVVLGRAEEAGLRQSRAKDWLERAVAEGKAHVWKYGSREKQKIANRPQERTGTLENLNA